MDIPNTYHIDSFVTSYRGKKKADEEGCEEYSGDEDNNPGKAKMAVRFLMALDMIVRGNVQISPIYAERDSGDALDIKKFNVPNDLLTRGEISTKIVTLRGNVCKERGLGNHYVIRKRYDVLLEEILRENEKVVHEDVPSLLSENLGIEPGTEKEEFPSVLQMKTNVNAVKSELRKKRVEAKYKMPQRYVDAIKAKH